MFAIIEAVVCGKYGFDLASEERGLMLWLTRIVLIPTGAILGAIGGGLVDFIIFQFFRFLLEQP